MPRRRDATLTVSPIGPVVLEAISTSSMITSPELTPLCILMAHPKRTSSRNRSTAA
jgi:hypothetical protein